VYKRGRIIWFMANLALCRWCGEYGHLVGDCPKRAKPIGKLEEIARVKKKWIKPTLTVWKKAEVFTPSSQVVHKSVNSREQSTVHKDRKEYRREWMRKRRESEKANRVG
jgi:hypothetical protein